MRQGRTIHHDIYGKDGAGKIKLRSAPKGTGIIAGGPVRAVCEVLGIRDIVAKSLGTANPHNVIRACMKALSNQRSPKYISNIRNKYCNTDSFGLRYNNFGNEKMNES